MARDIIIEKLDKEMRKDISEECQVIYILSKIRKILEIENAKQKYKILNFYCNWSLHSVIENTKPVENILTEFLTDEESRVNFLYFKYFIEEFGTFSQDHNLPSVIFEHKRLDKFLELLVEILSDTSVEFKTPSTKAKIIIKSVELAGFHAGIGYSISYE